MQHLKMCEQAQYKSFSQTQLYQEIQLHCGLEANSNYGLIRELQKREHGLVSRGRERNLANLFVPNQVRSKLREPPSHVYVNDRTNICHMSRCGSKLVLAYMRPTLPENGIQLLNAYDGSYSLLKNIEPNPFAWGITDMDLSPCGKFLAYSTFSDSIYIKSINGPNIWDRIILPVSQNHELVLPLRFSPCGRKLVGSFRDISYFVADIDSFNVKVVPLTESTKLNHVCALSFLTDRNPNVLACGYSTQGIVNVFDLRCYGVMATFPCHSKCITYIDARNDGNYFLTNAMDDSAKIWDLRKPPSSKLSLAEDDACLMTYRGHKVITFPQCAKFSPFELTGQRYIYAGCASGHIVVYDVLTGNIKTSFQGHGQVVSSLHWHPRRSEIVSGSWDGDIHINGYKSNASTNSDQGTVENADININLFSSQKVYLRHMLLLTKYMYSAK